MTGYFMPELTNSFFESLKDSLAYAYKHIANKPENGVWICNENEIVGEIFSVSKGKVVYWETDKTRGKLVTPDGLLKGIWSPPKGTVQLIISKNTDKMLMDRVHYLLKKRMEEESNTPEETKGVVE